MPLKVIIVGAGIGGICAAIALRQAGHDVEVNTQGFLPYPSSLSPADCIFITPVSYSLEKEDNYPDWIRTSRLLTVDIAPFRSSKNPASRAKWVPRFP